MWGLQRFFLHKTGHRVFVWDIEHVLQKITSLYFEPYEHFFCRFTLTTETAACRIFAIRYCRERSGCAYIRSPPNISYISAVFKDQCREILKPSLESWISISNKSVFVHDWSELRGKWGIFVEAFSLCNWSKRALEASSNSFFIVSSLKSVLSSHLRSRYSGALGLPPAWLYKGGHLCRVKWVNNTTTAAACVCIK